MQISVYEDMCVSVYEDMQKVHSQSPSMTETVAAKCLQRFDFYL